MQSMSGPRHVMSISITHIQHSVVAGAVHDKGKDASLEPAMENTWSIDVVDRG